MRPTNRNCPGCQVPPGTIHEDGCDMAVCVSTGEQLCQCAGEIHEYKGREYGEHEGPCATNYWNGSHPGEKLAAKLGWYAKFNKSFGWIACEGDDPDAVVDLNRICVDTVWDSGLQDRVLR